MPRLRSFVPCAAALVVAVAWIVSHPEDGAHGRTERVEPDAAAPDPIAASALQRAPDGERVAVAVVPTAERDESAAAVRDLEEILAAVAQAERARDGVELEARVLEALAPPHGVAALLHLLERPGVEEDRDVLAGALTTLALAATRDRARGRDAVVGAILAGLPAIVESARARLAPMLSNLVVEGRQVVGAHLWPRLLELQRAHPALHEDLAPLFANLHRDRAPLDAQVPLLVGALELVEFPEVAAAAARCLWAIDPDLGAALVSDARSRHGIAPELARELAQIAAQRLAPREALDSLAAESTSVALAGMLVIAERPEAADALRTKYSELAAAGADERGRCNVVFGMRREDSRVLLGIAETDPSPRVREQALLTLSSTRALDVGDVRALGALRHAGPASISTAACVTAAGNVVVKSRGAARNEALALLREVADDPTSGAADRRRALELLEKHAPPAEGDQAGK